MNSRLWLSVVFYCISVLGSSAWAEDFLVRYSLAPNETGLVQLYFSPATQSLQVTLEGHDFVTLRGKLTSISLPPATKAEDWPDKEKVDFLTQKNHTQGVNAATAIIMQDVPSKQYLLHLVTHGNVVTVALPVSHSIAPLSPLRIDTVKFHGTAMQVVYIFNPLTSQALTYLYSQGHVYEVRGVNLNPQDIYRTEFRGNVAPKPGELFGTVYINGTARRVVDVNPEHYYVDRAPASLMNDIIADLKSQIEDTGPKGRKRVVQVKNSSRAVVPVSSKTNTTEPATEDSKAEAKAETTETAYNPYDILNRDEILKFKVPDLGGEKVISLKVFIEREFEVLGTAQASDRDYEYYSKQIEMSMAALLMKQSGGLRILGKAGTGKSHFTKVLVSYILNKAKSPEFRERIYLRLDSSKLLAGTKYVGMMEAKIHALKELAKIVPVILVADEMHTLMGAGSHSKNSTDVFQHLKEELAEGRIKFIANTTDAEWERSFSGDPALVRRFPIAVKIEEPPLAKLLGIARNFLSERYKDARVEVSDRVIEEMALIAKRFDPLGANPSKTIQLLDFAMAYAESQTARSIESAQLLEIASRLYNYDLSGLTAEKVSERLANLDKELDKKLVGLERAKQLTQQALADHFLHQINNESTKPTALLAYGKRGTGKTTFGRALAEGLGFQFSRIMMSEFGHPGSAEDFSTKLALTLKANPFHVILLDEIEKAHPTVQQVLLRILDEGVFEARLSKVHNQATLTEIDASKAIMFAATNAGQAVADVAEKQASFPTLAEQDGLNRYVIDRFVTYIPIETPKGDLVRKILENKLAERLKAFTDLNRQIEVNTNEVIDYLLSKLNPEDRARLASFGFTGSGRRGGDSSEMSDVSVRALERELMEVSQMLSLYFVKNPKATALRLRVINGRLAMNEPEKENVPRIYDLAKMFRAQMGGATVSCGSVHLH